MGTIHYLPTAATLRKDFQDAINYLRHQDPVTLATLADEQKAFFVSGFVDRFFRKIDSTHKNKDLVLDSARANLHILISSAQKKRDAGYSDDKLREHWSRDVMPHIAPVMQIAVVSRDVRDLRRSSLGLDTSL
jgi:hypothetical protein